MRIVIPTGVAGRRVWYSMGEGEGRKGMGVHCPLSSRGNSRENGDTHWCSRKEGISTVRLASVWEEGEGRKGMSVQ
jgi:hypothetical protein